MNRTYLLLTALLGLPMAVHFSHAQELQRPNIVWIIAENANLEFGCYGEKLVSTPNIDRLAAEGLRYTRVFSTAPVCAPSRSAFMTGFYQTTTDTHHMRSHRDDDFRLPEGARPLTHRLKEAGYFTANIKEIEGEVVGTAKLDLNFVNEGPIFDTEDWAALKGRQPFFAMINMPEVVAPFTQEMHDWFGTPAWYRKKVPGTFFRATK